MRETIIHPRLKRGLGLAFEELSEKIVAYNPDVVCPVLRAGRYVLEGVEYFIQATRGIKFPSIDIMYVSPPFSPLAAEVEQEYSSLNTFDLEEKRREIEGKNIAVVDDLRYGGRTLKNVRSSLLEIGASAVRSFCLYNNTLLQKHFKKKTFDKYWHERVTSIGDLVPWRKDYHISGITVTDTVFIPLEDALKRLNSRDAGNTQQLYFELYNEEDIQRAKIRRQLFQAEITKIIDTYLKSKS